MLDPQLLRNDIESVAERLAVKGYVLDVESFALLEAQRKELQIEAEGLQAKRKSRSKMIGKTKAEGGDVDALMQEVASFADQLKTSQEKLDQVQAELSAITYGIPNIPHDSVPDGKTEDDNEEISQWGEPKKFDFEVKDHVDVGEAIGGLDFETATKITGSRFVVMKGEIAQLHRALTCLLYTSPSPRDS